MGRRAREHLFIETDGQVYLVRERGVLRFPRKGDPLPFPVVSSGRMTFDADIVLKQKPVLDRHPDEWMGRDEIFDRNDVDALVKRAIYTTMIRCVSEVVISKGNRVLMVKARRGFSKGHWNLPGGFMDYGESPEAGVEREAEEEIGASVLLDGLLSTYVSGFPGKPSYTLGFVYKGHLTSEALHLKPDEIDAAEWFTVDKGLTLTRNPFAKWGLVDFFLQSPGARRSLHVARHGISSSRSPAARPTVFLDRDGVINRGREGYVRTPDHFEFLPGAIDGMHRLADAGWRLVIVTNQDAIAWKLLPHAQLRRIHEKMIQGLRRRGVEIDEIYYCPHRLGAECSCRKPRPGMLLAAARDLGVNPRCAWMIGDKVLDVATGHAFGCRTAWVGPKEWRARFREDIRPWRPDVVADDLAAAAKAIVRRGLREGSPRSHDRVQA